MLTARQATTSAAVSSQTSRSPSTAGLKSRAHCVGHLSDQIGGNRIYATHDSSNAVFHLGFGGPMSAHCFEQAIAAGVSNALADGGAGSIDPDFGQDEVLVVDRAIRDEGTSFHYLPSSRWVEFAPAEVDRVISELATRGIPGRPGATWTTDADFRETRARIVRRRAEGCLTVEMEAASLAAVAIFRRVRYTHVHYNGDDVHSAEWSAGSWTASGRRAQLLEAALTVAGN
ncbi:nucleoside phosphorylase [Brevibacterium sp. CT2-23B]|uniref:nucleoside phosphorylase n=1 Tax=Brevibacterium sp. CT2-23B TaxID=2729630 RepID=UPI0034639690